MSIQYTGNAANAQAPASAPGPGIAPIILLPANGDPANGATFVQPFKTLADYVAYLVTQLAPATPPFFGDGSDGPLTVSGTTPLSGVVKNYTNLSISAGGILTVKRSIIRCTGTLTIDAAGLITGNGANGSGSTAGQGSDGTNGSITTPCPVGGGTSGGAGSVTSSSPGSNGKDFASVTNTTGLPENTELAYVGRSGAGAAGGTGSSGAASTGGCAGGTSDDDVLADIMTLFTPGFARRTRYASYNSGADRGSWAELVPLRGGGGGGGGGGNSGGGTGGGGGAGGESIWIFAKSIVIGGTNVIQALGGNGANGSGSNAGGGGGGRGGRIIIFHGGASGSTLAGSTVNGGSGGTATGSGVAGTAGGSGQLFVKQVA